MGHPTSWANLVLLNLLNIVIWWIIRLLLSQYQLSSNMTINNKSTKKILHRHLTISDREYNAHLTNDLANLNL